MNNKLTYKKPKITRIDFEHRSVEQEFDGFRILHLSDLHNKEFGLNQSILIEITQENNPDLIAITGDILNRGRFDKTLQYIKEAVKVAPVFFTSGNHEYYSKQYNFIKDRLVNAGAKVLDNRIEEISINNKVLSIIGVRDASFFKNKEAFNNTITALCDKAKGFRLMLTHKPHLIDAYQNSGADLVLSGHAHGGQVRLLFVGGLYAPGQGIFPRYTSGLYRLKNGVSMIVNRGLGDSQFPWRINNPPHVIVITLKPKS